MIFNARSESVLEKRMFRESTLHRRIVVPAAWFYEWNQRKEKNIFSSKEQPAIFMAGIYNYDQEEERFVILTTAANESMKPVHDRMPLILKIFFLQRNSRQYSWQEFIIMIRRKKDL